MICTSLFYTISHELVITSIAAIGVIVNLLMILGDFLNSLTGKAIHRDLPNVVTLVMESSVVLKA